MALVRFTAAALALLAATASAKIHHLTIKNDPRYAFSIESFGFLEGGTVSIRVHDVAASPPNAHHMMGFVLYPTSTESRIAEQIDTLITKRQCALDAENEGIYIINASDPASWKREAPLEVTIDRPGLYDLLFTHCEPAGGQTSFTVRGGGWQERRDEWQPVAGRCTANAAALSPACCAHIALAPLSTAG